jgi:hypothetical protein
MEYEQLSYIKETIENMSKNHQIDVLKIFKQNNKIMLNENGNGIFVNLSELDNDDLDKLSDFIKYVNKQQEQLNHVEDKKTNIENEFFKSK